MLRHQIFFKISWNVWRAQIKKNQSFDQSLIFKNQSLIKLWLQKSKFDKSLIQKSKLWFYSQSFVKLWLLKSKFYQTLISEYQTLIKTLILKNQSLIKLWLWKSKFDQNFDKTLTVKIKVLIFNLRFSYISWFFEKIVDVSTSESQKNSLELHRKPKPREQSKVLGDLKIQDYGTSLSDQSSPQMWSS